MACWPKSLHCAQSIRARNAGAGAETEKELSLMGYCALVAQPEGLPRHEAGLQPAEMDKKIRRLNSNQPEEESVNKENHATEISLL